jgi:hypothetical protein
MFEYIRWICVHKDKLHRTVLSKCILFTCLMLLPVCQQQASAQEGGIEVFAGETLFEAGTRGSITHIYKRKGSLLMGHNEISDPQDGLYQEHRTVLSIDHGFKPDLTATLLFPYVEKSLDTVALGTQRASGIGDASVLLKYRVVDKGWKRSAFYVALIGGAELPTGTTSERDAGVRLAPGLQPGSGSVDPFVAVSATLSLDRFRFDNTVFYKVNTEGSQDFDEGDFFSVSSSVAYRFLHTRYPGPTASVKVGLQYRHQGRDQISDVNVASSGSDELLARFGVTLHPKPAWDIKASVDVPVYQDVNGMQLAQDVRLFFGLGLRF